MKILVVISIFFAFASCAVQEDYAEQYEIPGLGISASSEKSAYTALADNGPLRSIRLFSEYDMKNGEIMEEWYAHNNHQSRSIRVKIAYYKGSMKESRKYYRTYIIAPGEVQPLRDKRSGNDNRLLARLVEASYLR